MHSITITLTEAAQRAAILAGQPAQAVQSYDVPAELLPRLLALPWSAVAPDGRASAVVPARMHMIDAQRLLGLADGNRGWTDSAPSLCASQRPSDAAAAIAHGETAVVVLREALAREEEARRAEARAALPRQIERVDGSGGDYWAHLARSLASQASLDAEETERHVEAVLAAAEVVRARDQAASAACEAREKAEQEAKAARLQAKVEYLRAWILEHGTEDQRERVVAKDGPGRLRLGLLPEDEAIDAVREASFAGLDALPLYSDLTDADLTAEDDECEHRASYESEECLDVPPEPWASLKRVRALAPDGAICVVRYHRASCDHRGCGVEVERYGILVQIEVCPGLTLSREYAAE